MFLLLVSICISVERTKAHTSYGEDVYAAFSAFFVLASLQTIKYLFVCKAEKGPSLVGAFLF
jgi:hypothetical protein